MRKYLISGIILLLSYMNLFSQDEELIVVKAGTRVIDYFPVSERYRFVDFKEGQLVFRNGLISSALINYNLLLGEMEFIRSSDTLTIANKKEISYISVARDTFFYDNGYIEIILSGPVKVGRIQAIRLKDIQRKGAYGMTDRNSAIDTYSAVPTAGKFYELVPDEDWVLQKFTEYYVFDPVKGFVQYNKKNINGIFPQRKNEIKAYLKSNKVDFRSMTDLLKLAAYLGSLDTESLGK